MDKTQVKQTYEVFSYIQYVTTLFDRACSNIIMYNIDIVTVKGRLGYFINKIDMYNKKKQIYTIRVSF